MGVTEYIAWGWGCGLDVGVVVAVAAAAGGVTPPRFLARAIGALRLNTTTATAINAPPHCTHCCAV